SHTCVGDGPFLCAQDACDFTRTPECPHHFRPVSIFEESTLSRWKRVYFLRSGADLRVGNCPHRYRYSHSPDRPFYTARRTAIRTSIRSSVAQLQKASATMAMSEEARHRSTSPRPPYHQQASISKSCRLRYVHQRRGLTLLTYVTEHVRMN